MQTVNHLAPPEADGWDLNLWLWAEGRYTVELITPNGDDIWSKSDLPDAASAVAACTEIIETAIAMGWAVPQFDMGQIGKTVPEAIVAYCAAVRAEERAYLESDVW